MTNGPHHLSGCLNDKATTLIVGAEGRLLSFRQQRSGSQPETAQRLVVDSRIAYAEMLMKAEAAPNRIPAGADRKRRLTLATVRAGIETPN